MVELWWDAEAEGPDETGEDGTGLYRYVNDGERYLPHEYTSDVEVFDRGNSVTQITDPPPAEIPPDYPLRPADTSAPALAWSGSRGWRRPPPSAPTSR